MVATAYIEINTDEIQEAVRQRDVLGLRAVEIPKSVLNEIEFLFSINSSASAFKIGSKIRVNFHNGSHVVLKYEEKVYDRLNEYFKHI